MGGKAKKKRGKSSSSSSSSDSSVPAGHRKPGILPPASVPTVFGGTSDVNPQHADHDDRNAVGISRPTNKDRSRSKTKRGGMMGWSDSDDDRFQLKETQIVNKAPVSSFRAAAKAPAAGGGASGQAAYLKTKADYERERQLRAREKARE